MNIFNAVENQENDDREGEQVKDDPTAWHQDVGDSIMETLTKRLLSMYTINIQFFDPI
jgi:hypothetical protein